VIVAALADGVLCSCPRHRRNPSNDSGRAGLSLAARLLAGAWPM